MRTLKVQLLVLLTLCFSCIKELGFHQQENNPVLVLNGILCPDSLVWIHLSRTTPFSSQDISIVENAEVFLYENGVFIEQLNHFGDGYYRAVSARPLPGAIYRITAFATGFPKVEACDTIPIKTDIESGIYQDGLSFDQYGDPHSDYTITFTDPQGPDFYELFFIQQQEGVEDSFYHVDFSIDPEIADPVLQADSELDYFTMTYVFTDDLFESTTYTMYNKFRNAVKTIIFKNKIVPDCNEKYAVLRTVSNAYYLYRKSWIRHSGNQQNSSYFTDPIDFFNTLDPVPMYSNIEGGYGIFAAYNQSHYLLRQE